MVIDFKALAAPIPPNRVKTKPGRGGGTFSYVTARTVMNRLDQAVGPENWRDDFRELSGGNVMCTIFVRVDGEWIGKSDIGTESDVEEDKGAFSDAFKRAGVKWGIARELYKEGTAYDDPMPPRPAASAPRNPPPPARKPVEQPAPKAEPEPEVAEVVKAATLAPQTREERRIPNGDEVNKPKRRNLRTKEIEALKTFIKAISPEIQAEKGLTAEYHAAGSILKAMKLDDWKQLTIAEDNEAEELAAIRARIQKHVDENHVAPDAEPEALKPAA